MGNNCSASVNETKGVVRSRRPKKRKRPPSKKDKSIKEENKQEDWQEKLADELRKPIKRNFTRRRVIVNHIDEICCTDLVEMRQFSKWNKGYRYVLMVLDVFSKYGWIVPLKDKEGESVTKAFRMVIEEGPKPEYLLINKGKLIRT